MLETLKNVIGILEENAVIERRFDGLICLSNPDYALYMERPDPAVVKDLDADAEKWGHLLDCLFRYMDGNMTLLDIAERHDLPFARAGPISAALRGEGACDAAAGGRSPALCRGAGHGMITLIDSGICNLASVTTALNRVGAAWTLAETPEQVARAGALLLPGVGAFADGMESLRIRGLVEPIKAHAAQGRPILGICLGMQLLAEGSEEFGDHEGLGLVPGGSHAA